MSNNPLGYPNDVGVDDFIVTQDVRILNTIQEAGPPPNGVYGPGSWIKVWKSTVYQTATITNGQITNPTVASNLDSDIAITTRGVNNDAPGLKYPGLNTLPLTVEVKPKPGKTVTTADTFQVIEIFFSLSNPTVCRPNPKSEVFEAQLTNLGMTDNITPTNNTSASTVLDFSPPSSGYQPLLTKVPAAEIATFFASGRPTDIYIPKTIFKLILPAQNNTATPTPAAVNIALVASAGAPVIRYQFNLNIESYYVNRPFFAGDV